MIRPRLSIVLPCYNEAANLPGVVERYREVWQDLPAELILVDNGSTDATAEVLASLIAQPAYRFARTVRVPVNRGYGYGIWQGLLAARGETLAFSHADQQCDAADVFTAYHELFRSRSPHSTLVKGRRRGRALQSRFVTSVMSVVAGVVLGYRLRDINAQPKLFPSELLEDLSAPPNGFEFDLYVLYRARRAGYQVRTVPVEFGPRAHGVSKWATSVFSRWRTMLGVFRYIFRLRLSGGA
ncbi:MAG: glycosyltransferase family 2 protein [Planctomycetota bacterium]